MTKTIRIVKTACLIITCLFISATGFAAAYINYAEALQKSLYFYDAEKSGPGISGGRLDWRGDSEVEDQWIKLDTASTFLSSSFISQNKSILDPDGNGTVDLSGGFHDAGDHVKFGLPQCYSASTLGWGLYEFKDGFVRIGEYEHMLEILKWFTDYFLRCTFRNSQGQVIAFCHQVGDGDIDHDYWGPPELQRVEEYPRTARFATADKPGSDQCAGTAAALALMYLNYKSIDAAYANKCLDTALALYAFAIAHRGLADAGTYYQSSYDADEMSWAAVWLHIATGEQKYLNQIISKDSAGKYTGYLGKIIVDDNNGWQNIWVHSWDTVWGGVFAKIAPLTNNPFFWYVFRWNIEYWTGTGSYQVAHLNPGGGGYIATSPDGWSFLNTWGSARYNACGQLMALLYKKYATLNADPNGGKPDDFIPWAQDQMRYIMGENPMGRSYLVGYSDNYAAHPHHRAAHGSTTNRVDEPVDHVHTLWGALVGGPDDADNHVDSTGDYIYNEVAIDYNAGFVAALAGHVLNSYAANHMPLADFPQPEAPIEANYAESKLEQENDQRTQVTVAIKSITKTPPHFQYNLKFRYFFNISELINVSQSINDVTFAVYYDEENFRFGGDVKYRGPLQWGTDPAVYYVEFDYTDCEIYGSRELQLALVAAQASDYKSHWDPTNDWSRQGITGKYARNTRIPMYLGDTLVFGETPPGGPVTTPSPTPTRTPTRTPTGITCSYGDVDCNGTINIIDALKTAQYSVGIAVSGFTVSAADVNRDGAITIVDALIIAQYSVGLLSSLPL